MVDTFSPRIWAEAGGSLRVLGQPCLQNEFKDGQGQCYTEKLCLKRKKITSLQSRGLAWLAKMNGVNQASFALKSSKNLCNLHKPVESCNNSRENGTSPPFLAMEAKEKLPMLKVSSINYSNLHWQWEKLRDFKRSGETLQILKTTLQHRFSFYKLVSSWR